MNTLHDMHCHLGSISNGEEIACDARLAGSLLFANTVDRADWVQTQNRFGALDNVFIGYGMHPWWVNAGTSTDVMAENLNRANPRYIGEIGLDFGKRHMSTKASQIEAYAQICRWAGERGGRLISIHSVNAAQEALDILGQSGASESCSCIFHWYSGPSDQLKRAIQMGCYFSLGTKSLATRKGREYVKAIPIERLLLETDYPPQRGQTCSYAELREQLEAAADSISAIKGVEATNIMASTSESLLKSC